MHLATAIIYGLFTFPALAQTPSQIDRLTQQWLDTERQTVRLQSDWKEQQPVLNQRLALLLEERKQLQSILEQNNAGQGDVDARRVALLEEQAELEGQQAKLEQALTLLQSRVESIEPLLPPPLKSTWQAEKELLDVEADTSQRLQVALAQLSHVADFDSRVSVHESAIALEGESGQLIMVKQFYLGLGMAWFTNTDGKVSGWGQADENGWRWQFDQSISAPDVQKAINIFEKKQAAELVRLPVSLAPINIAGAETRNAANGVRP